MWRGFDAKQVPGIWLQREVTIPAAWAGRRILLRSELIEQPATVFIDGKQIGILAPPGDCLDLTVALKPGAAQVLRFSIARGYEAPADAPVHVVGPIGAVGVAGSIRLDAIAPRVAIDDVFLTPSTRKERLQARVRFHGAAAEKKVRLRATITDTHGTAVRTIDASVGSVAAGESFRNVSFPWADPILWEIDRPHLYRITITALNSDGQPLDTWGPETFGFREFWLDGKEMMLNGHPCRFRLLWHWGVAQNNLAFYQGIGFNAIAIQPRDGQWFSGWGANDDIDVLADLLDRRGMALIATGKTINGIDRLVRDDPRIRSYFERTTQMRISRYANHPSILAWNISLNVGNSHDEWMPPGIGQLPKGERSNHPVAVAADLVAKLDPTRTVMAHAGGNIAPIASANVYLNFVPLQEREEWLSEWARSGKRPFAAIEFGPPYSANFFRRGAFGDPMFTEYCAIFRGDAVYRDEETAYVEQVEALTKANAGGHGGASIYEGGADRKPLQTFAAENTAFFPVVSEFVTRTNRAWRAFGHNGGSHPWMWNIGFGGTPSGPMGAFFYAGLDWSEDQLRKRPDWANDYYDAYRETLQPLLVFIGGRAERFTERDHTFFPGETVEKQIIAIWDGSWPTEIVCRWNTIFGPMPSPHVEVRLKLRPGEIRKVPISFRIPENGGPGGEITLSVTDPQGKRLASDVFSMTVLSPPLRIDPKPGVLLWDPAGKSVGWIRQLGLRPRSWKPGKPIPAGSTLIIGREGLSAAERLPFTRADLDAGLRVLVIEQQSEALQRFGFRTADTFSRRLFLRDQIHPAITNFGQELLEDWRGSATLLPEYIPLDDFNPVRPRCTHWGNYGVVATTLIETPQHGNFTPIVVGEFDMRYSPLLEWTCGRGRVLFSQFDFTGRVGSDPAATQLARTLLQYETTAPPPALRRAVYIGGPKGRELVARLGLDVDLQCSVDKLPPGGLAILGEGPAADAAALDRFAQEGGWVLALPRPATEFAGGWLPFAVKTERRKAHRTSFDAAPRTEGLPLQSALMAPFRGLGPADLHWRDVAEFDVFAFQGQAEGTWLPGDGFFLVALRGKGGWLLSQADPAPYENAGTVSLRTEWPAPGWSDQPDRMIDVPKPWLRETRQRFDRVYSQIIADLGAGPSDALAERVLSFVPGPRFRPPADWQIAASPTPDDKWSPTLWRKVVGSMRIDFRGATSVAEGIACAKTAILADSEAVVPMRVRFGWGVKTADISLNGQPVFVLRKNQWCPRQGHEIMLPLILGNNELMVKITGVFDVQLAVQETPDPRLKGNADILYCDPVRLGDDPYAWFAW